VRLGCRRPEVLIAQPPPQCRIFSAAEDYRRKEEMDSRAFAVVGPPGGVGLRGLTEIAMVQAADFWKLHDLARRGELDGPELGCILVEREVCARLMVIGEVAGQDAAQVSVAKDEHVIQTFGSGGTDQALRERVLPGALRRRQDFGDPHTPHSVAKRLAIDLVTIA
jgi:hypothetical protein